MSNLLLKGITVFELAGLAPGPLCGQIFSDYGARVIRIDRAAPFNPDQLTRGKQSIALNLQHKNAQSALRSILETDKVDVLIDPYRPGVLERLNILPTSRPNNASPLVVARLTGYGQSGPLAKFAGHDINYLAESGILDIIGPPNKPPTVPANILGDFAALALPAFSAILTALYSNLRSKTSGQKLSTQPYTLIDVNIVNSLKYLGQFATYAKYGPHDPKQLGATSSPGYVSIVPWCAPRGQNVLEGFECPYYTIYETSDSQYITVGALEPQFYSEFQKLVFGDTNEALQTIQNLPDRDDPKTWDTLRDIYTKEFKKKDITHWKAQVAKYPDSCVMPVKQLTHSSAIPDQIVDFAKPTTHVGPKIGPNFKLGTPRGFMLTPGKDTFSVLDEFLGAGWKDTFGTDFATQASPSKQKKQPKI